MTLFEVMSKFIQPNRSSPRIVVDVIQDYSFPGTIYEFIQVDLDKNEIRFNRPGPSNGYDPSFYYWDTPHHNGFMNRCMVKKVCLRRGILRGNLAIEVLETAGE